MASKTVGRLTALERLNFLLTNRIPRRWSTLFMGWFSRIENPLVRSTSIAVWKAFADDLNLHEAKKTRFSSMHDCFIRELKDGARPVDPARDILTSPCDAIVGEGGEIEGTRLYQAKGFPYTLGDLLGESALADRYRDGSYVTLRLKSSMYHRFHAPYACEVPEVTYFSGDTWNVNPIALKCVERLFCKNERAAIELQLEGSRYDMALVPVAAILVASIRIHGLDEVLNLKYKGPNRIRCGARFDKGEEMGYFHHGSTILAFVPRGFRLHEEVRTGSVIRVGQPLFRFPGEAALSVADSLLDPGGASPIPLRHPNSPNDQQT